MPEREPPRREEPRSAELPGYFHAARFAKEAQAKTTYDQAQALILAEPSCDLSTYRFLLSGDSYVAVLGIQPPEELDAKIQELLVAGERTKLPADVVDQLHRRRAGMIKKGPWVEGHY